MSDWKKIQEQRMKEETELTDLFIVGTDRLTGRVCCVNTEFSLSLQVNFVHYHSVHELL